MPSEPFRDRLGGRLRRLPGDLALALVNATALLVILAAVLAIVAVGRVENAGARLAAAAAEAAFAELGVAPESARAELREIARETARIATAIEAAEGEAGDALEAGIDRIEGQLAEIRQAIEAAGAAGPALAEVAIREAADGLGDALARARGCEAPPRP